MPPRPRGLLVDRRPRCYHGPRRLGAVAGVAPRRPSRKSVVPPRFRPHPQGENHAGTRPACRAADRRPRRCPCRAARRGRRGRRADPREPGPARRPHGLVARGPLRHVHPLGALRHPRRPVEGSEGPECRGVDPVQRQDPPGRLRAAPEAVPSREVRRPAVGGHRQARRHEVRRHHLQAPRGVLPVRLEAHRLRRDGHAAEAGHPEGAFRGMPGGGIEDVLVPLDPRLAPPRLPAPGCRQPAPLGHPAHRGGRLQPLHRLHEGPAHGAADPLRPDRRALVRRRLGAPRPGAPRRGGRGHDPPPPAADHHQRPHPASPGLQHARAAHSRHRHSRARLGDLHDHERHLGLSAG